MPFRIVVTRKFSSANFYATGESGVYVVTNYAELEDVDLTN